MPKGDSKVLKAKKTTFSSRHGLYNILFLSLNELDTCLQNPQEVWNIKEKKNSTRGYAEIHIQRQFFDNKKGIQKIVVLKIQTVSTCFGASSM
jgi:hypothetical protein